MAVKTVPVKPNQPRPIRLPRPEPQPTLALLRPRADFYASAYPTTRDVLLVAEILGALA